MRYLYKFHWDFGRQGDVEGLFVASEEQIENLIGKYVSFGEILGKHSDVYGTIEDDDVTKQDLDSETVEKVAKILGDTWSGYNPSYYMRIECKYCGDSFNRDDMHDDETCYYCHEQNNEYADSK